MKTNLSLIYLISVLTILAIFSSCEKDPASVNEIQHGNNTVEMNAIYTGYYLQVRYNGVIDAPIKATVKIYQHGKTMNVPVNIPAGYKSLQHWGGDDYVNAWNYNGFYDSIGVNHLPVISGNVDSLEIIAVSCPDKQYGFSILSHGMDWSEFYHPTDPRTIVSFISNKDTVSYNDYDFSSGTVSYNKSVKYYRFGLFNNMLQMISAAKDYPLQPGMTMDIPVLVYYWNGRNYGIQPDGPQASTNGSTLQLTITRLSGTNFDATFSGKIWSSRQEDTLIISNGEIKNALLPVLE